MNKTEQLVFEKSVPLAKELCCSIYDVEFLKEGKDFILRVFIDKPGGIFISDCEAVSHKISDMLDLEDPIKQSYCLEVSSPGVSRNLKRLEHYKAAVGSTIAVKLYKSVENQKTFKGPLLSADEENIALEINGRTVKIKYNEIAKANIHVEF